MDRVTQAYQREASLANLLFEPYFAGAVQEQDRAWRSVLQTATELAIAMPAMSSALVYHDVYRSARLPANLIQAQWDYVGAHTYQRVDRPGTFHTEWQTR